MEPSLGRLNQDRKKGNSRLLKPWTASVSVLGHSWPTFSLFPPVHSSLFTWLWAEFFISSSVQNARGGVNNFTVPLVFQLVLNWKSIRLTPVRSTGRCRRYYKVGQRPSSTRKQCTADVIYLSEAAREKWIKFCDFYRLTFASPCNSSGLILFWELQSVPTDSFPLLCTATITCSVCRFECADWGRRRKKENFLSTDPFREESSEGRKKPFQWTKIGRLVGSRGKKKSKWRQEESRERMIQSHVAIKREKSLACTKMMEKKENAIRNASRSSHAVFSSDFLRRRTRSDDVLSHCRRLAWRDHSGLAHRPPSCCWWRSRGTRPTDAGPGRQPLHAADNGPVGRRPWPEGWEGVVSFDPRCFDDIPGWRKKRSAIPKTKWKIPNLAEYSPSK